MDLFKKAKLKKQKEKEVQEKWLVDNKIELLAREFPYITQGMDQNFHFTGQVDEIEYDAISLLDFVEQVKKLPIPPLDYEETENYTPPHILVQATKEYLGIARVEYSKWLVSTNKIKLDHFMHNDKRFLYNLDQLKELVEFFWLRC